MGGEKWQQMNLDGGDVLVVLRKSRRGGQVKEKKPPDDRGAVLSFIKRMEIAFDAGEELPSFRELTNKDQRRIYYGIMATRRREQEEYQQQWKAEERGLTQLTYDLDNREFLEGDENRCISCGDLRVRDVTLLSIGRRNKRGSSRIRISDSCINCSKSGMIFDFRISNEQLITERFKLPS